MDIWTGAWIFSRLQATAIFFSFFQSLLFIIWPPDALRLSDWSQAPDPHPHLLTRSSILPIPFAPSPLYMFLWWHTCHQFMISSLVVPFWVYFLFSNCRPSCSVPMPINKKPSTNLSWLRVCIRGLSLIIHIQDWLSTHILVVKG